MRNSQLNTGSRLEYLDSLRGIAMLFVIYFHLLAYHSEPISSVNDFVIRWRMPLFFFVSGFFALFTRCDSNLFKKRIRNRFVKQLYPTIVVWAIFILVSWLIGDESFSAYFKHGIYDPAKRGYWFTTSLVEVYILYAVVAYTLYRLKISLREQGVIYFALFLILGVSYISLFQTANPQGVFLQVYSVLSVEKFICLIPFFFLGLACRCFFEQISAMIEKTWFMVAAVLAFFGVSCVSPVSTPESVAYFLSRIIGLIAMLSVFTHFRQYLDTTTAAGRYLNRIGRNTLPIYLFHFFLIILIPYGFAGYEELKMLLEQHWWIELPVVMSVSMLIAEICLTINRLIKRSNSFHRLIFNPI